MKSLPLYTIHFTIHFTILFTTLALFTSCGYNNTKKTPTAPTASLKDSGTGTGLDKTPTQIDFARIKSQIFEPKCFKCHSDAGGNKDGINLETYTNVKSRIENILSAIKDNSMPKSGQPLSAEDKELLEKWVKAGAPETITKDTSTTTPQPQPQPQPPPPSEHCDDHNHKIKAGLIVDIDSHYSADSKTMSLQKRNDDCKKEDDKSDDDTKKPVDDKTPSKLDFATIRTQIFEPKCFKCHSVDGGNRHDVNLETYANVKPIIQDILDAVKNDFMPRKAPPLTAAEKELLERWVKDGAPETTTNN